jgi:bifunctional non-homologous end joining protein LigD
MSALLPELGRVLPPDVQLDGELVAYGRDGRPDCHRLSSRMLHGDRSVAVTYAIFDVLGVEGVATTAQPYAQRRALLETLDLEREGVQLVATFEDGQALFDATVGAALWPPPRLTASIADEDSEPNHTRVIPVLGIKMRASVIDEAVGGEQLDVHRR